MKCDVFARSTGFQSSSLGSIGKTFEKFRVFGTRKMASNGRLLGLQLPPVPSYLSDVMPACVRSAHIGDAKERSSLAESGNDVGADMNRLEEPQAMKSHSSLAFLYTDQDVEEVKPTDKKAKEKATSPITGWAPYFNFGSNVDGDAKPSTNDSPPSAESRPTTPAEDYTSGTKEAGENSHSQSRGLRSKLTSMLSLEKRVSLTGLPLVAGHSNQFMMEMSGFQSTSFTRRAPIADSKICAAIQKESFARMFDLYDERNMVASVPSYDAPGGYVARSIDASDVGVVRADPSWVDDKGNDAWGIEPWHSDQRNILMKTLHIMRCDIESLKMMLRSLDLPAAKGGLLDPHLHETTGYMHNMRPVATRSNSALSETKQYSCRPSDDEQTENRIDSLKEDKELALIVEKDRSSETGKDLCASEVPPPGNEESDESVSTWSHGSPKKRKQWWRELLAAFGLTVWVITGAVLVAKAIGVPHLGVSNNVAYNGYWGRSDDEETKIPVQGAMGVVELGSYTFNDVIKKRPTFVMFYAPWCPHCQRLHPVWTQLAAMLSKRGYDVQLATVDATKHTRLADKYEVPGFPTLIMFKKGMPVGRHRGARDIDALLSFIDNNK